MTRDVTGAAGSHQQEPVHTAGAALDEAAVAVIMMHGRDATAESILTLAVELDTAGVAYLAPQAADRTWYPHSFLAPLEQNEPALSSALDVMAGLVQRIEETGLPPGRLALLGFSQGACLALEFAARHPRHYGGVFGLSGGLIGPEGTTFDYEGAMDGTPVFVGCSDRDPHIPVRRVHETTRTFRHLGAAVEERIYRGMGHAVNRDEIAFVRSRLARMRAREKGSS